MFWIETHIQFWFKICEFIHIYIRSSEKAASGNNVSTLYSFA